MNRQRSRKVKWLVRAAVPLMTLSAVYGGGNDPVGGVCFEFQKAETPCKDPEIKNYIPQGEKLNNKKLTLKTDVKLVGTKDAKVTNVKSNNSEDDLSKTEGVVEFALTLSTKESEGDRILKGDADVGVQDSDKHKMLPARFEDGFHCTVYYTFLETGVTAEKNYTAADMIETTKTIGGHQFTAKYGFWSAVRLEGAGKLDDAQHGKLYIGHDGSNYFISTVALGNKNNALTEKVSCAADQAKTLAFGWKVRVNDDKVKKAFGNDTFTVADVGGAINGYELDLYYGEEKTLRKGTSLPEMPVGSQFFEGFGMCVDLISQ